MNYMNQISFEQCGELIGHCWNEKGDQCRHCNAQRLLIWSEPQPVENPEQTRLTRAGAVEEEQTG